MPKDYSHKNLQKASFKDEDLTDARFSDSDLRGADFSGANLTGADLTGVRTGITPMNKVWLFLATLVVSLFSGYIAMLAGHTVQVMLASKDEDIRNAGILTMALSVLFIIFVWWKGGGTAIRNLLIPVVVLALVLGVVFKISGLGTGRGLLYLVIALLLLVVMFIVGTVARAAAGTLSSTILFLVVAIGGSIFGKSVGGGVGTVIMAIACAMISKKALSGAKGFEGLQKIARYITTRFGTSFRNARLREAHFSRTLLNNSDFSNADVSRVDWGDTKIQNCFYGDNLFTIKTR